KPPAVDSRQCGGSPLRLTPLSQASKGRSDERAYRAAGNERKRVREQTEHRQHEEEEDRKVLLHDIAEKDKKLPRNSLRWSPIEVPFDGVEITRSHAYELRVILRCCQGARANSDPARGGEIAPEGEPRGAYR